MIKTDRKKITNALKKRGWQTKHIAKVNSIIKKGEEKKERHIKILDGMLYWLVLIFVLIGNMIVLVGVLPIMIKMPEWVLIFVLSVIGVAFGFIVDMLIRDINLSIGNYIFAGFLIPVIAIINMLFVIEIGKVIGKMIGIYIKINPLLVICFYIVSFSLPHIIYQLKEQKKINSSMV